MMPTLGRLLVGGRMLTASLAEWPAGGTAVAAHVDPPPPIGPGDMTVARARQLHATGRPHEALRVLEGIDLADPARPFADELRGLWQRELLASADAGVPRASGGPR
jgi:poly(3-hydroxybutyrate) depolymerase